MERRHPSGLRGGVAFVPGGLGCGFALGQHRLYVGSVLGHQGVALICKESSLLMRGR